MTPAEAGACLFALGALMVLNALVPVVVFEMYVERRKQNLG